VHESPEVAAIPKTLERLITRGDDMSQQIVLAVVALMKSIPFAATRAAATRVLRSTHPDAVAALLSLLQHDEESHVRVAAAYALVGALGPSVFHELLSSLRADGSPEVRVASARTLLATDQKRAQAEFARILAEGDSATRLAVEEATRAV
jgi:HEAT repeat protein